MVRLDEYDDAETSAPVLGSKHPRSLAGGLGRSGTVRNQAKYRDDPLFAGAGRKHKADARDERCARCLREASTVATTLNVRTATAVESVTGYVYNW